ncbi:hypothetical protein ASPBRDRAFT_48541 [Aspergillus brasiliensis CBS 101740]|uniref:Uncharacterized protein n=1 Tax=Aspergillus brasiliensis (strain CBS 101740 / IMI 381727 / IBT 21946) TaxID=767769 RepID=A0A1L9U618_ASPBC|nr:hypothetical protein ASPBRDRAFT_48541 [Aspergillus brasiliensis CBS 101740]
MRGVAWPTGNGPESVGISTASPAPVLHPRFEFVTIAADQFTSLIIATSVRSLPLPLQEAYGFKSGRYGDHSERRSGYLSKWGTDAART